MPDGSDAPHAAIAKEHAPIPRHERVSSQRAHSDHRSLPHSMSTRSIASIRVHVSDEKENEEEKAEKDDFVAETTPLLTKPVPTTPSYSHSYTSASFQILLLSLALSFGPTFWGALQALGGAGRGEHAHTSAGLAVLYVCFTVSCLVVGTLGDRMRAPRTMLAIGGLGHVQYIAVLWLIASQKSDTRENVPANAFVELGTITDQDGVTLLIISSAILGLCKGPLWITQSQLFLSYPDASNRGSSAGTYVTVNNLVSVLGSLLPFVLNYMGGDGKGGVSEATYGVATALISLSFLFPLLMASFTSVRRSDGSSPQWEPVDRTKTLIADAREMLATFVMPEMLLLAPLLFSFGAPASFIWNHLNLPRFTVRTRALNNILARVFGIASGAWFARRLDSSHSSPRARARKALKITAGLIALFWASVGIFGYLVEPRQDGSDEGKLDFLSADSWAGVAVYAGSGLVDGLAMVFVYWLIAHLSLPPSTHVRFSAARHVWGAVALAVGFGMSAAGVGERWQWGWCASWGVGGFVPVYWLIERHVADEQAAEDGEEEVVV